MQRILETPYPTLLQEYENLWSSLPGSDITKLLEVLRAYSNGRHCTHGKTIESIIQPYYYFYPKKPKVIGNIECSLSIHTLLLQICEKIPEKAIKPQRGLAAIFQVMKNNTGIDIYDIYDNMNRTSLKSLDMKNIILFLCAASDSSPSNTFNILPRDVILVICQLMMKPFVSWENNGVYRLLLELLEGYCGFNKTIPEHLKRPYAPVVKDMILEHHTLTTNLFMNAGGLLFKLFRTILPEEISHDDGLHHIFSILQDYAGIDVSEFDKNSLLIDFFTRNGTAIANNTHYKCWIEMISDNRSTFLNASEDTALLLSRPYFSASGKNEMINSFIKHGEYDNYKFFSTLNVCGELITCSQQELIYSFLTALRNKKYNIAMYLLCKANNKTPPDKSSDCFYYFNNKILDNCETLLWKLFDKTEKDQSRLLIELLDYASTIEEKKQSHNILTAHTYEKLLERKDFLPEWEMIERKFIRCFIPDINHFFYKLLTTRYYDKTLIMYLLESKIPGINILGNNLKYNRAAEINLGQAFLYTSDDHPSWNIGKTSWIIVKRSSVLQAIMLCSTTNNHFGSDLLPLVKALVAYDGRCLFQKDSTGNDIIHYLKNIKIEDISVPEEKKRYLEICEFIYDKYKNYYPCDMHTLFRECKKEQGNESAPLKINFNPGSKQG